MQSTQQQDVIDLFSRCYSRCPSVVTRAPGRVELLGNHTDYNEGSVLSFAIDNSTWVAIDTSDAACQQFCSSHYGSMPVEASDPGALEQGSWIRYPLGVYSKLKQQNASLRPCSFAIHSTIPAGAGLSSSAALEVACGLALNELFDAGISKEELALLCQQAEHEFAGTHCGLLDQYSSIFGQKSGVLYTDFRTLEHRTISMPSPAVRIAITMSSASHALADTAYNERRRECDRAAAFFAQRAPSVKTLRDVSTDQIEAAQGDLDEAALRRARHIVGENRRVHQGITFLEKNDLAAFGSLLKESHESSRVNFENSCEELDLLVSIASGIDGVYGSRLTGGGFGGATLSMLEAGIAKDFEKRVVSEYQRHTGLQAQVYFTSVAQGAETVYRKNR
jgi:galactokinase